MELRISQFAKRFESESAERSFVLRAPPLVLRSGEVVFLMGHNGSGKSVYLDLLAGDLFPSEGRVVFRSSDAESLATNDVVGIVRQRAEESLAVDLTVEENLLLRLDFDGILSWLRPAAQLTKKVSNILLDYADLQRKQHQLCSSLSVGQRQTLAFLAVTLSGRSVLLLDEFLAATDLMTSRRLRQLVSRYAAQLPACVVIVSHDVELALSDADRILVLRDGDFKYDIHRNSPEWNEVTLVRWLSHYGGPT